MGVAHKNVWVCQQTDQSLCTTRYYIMLYNTGGDKGSETVKSEVIAVLIDWRH